MQKTEDDLLAITNFGPKSLDEVIQKLDERGLSLRMKDCTDARSEEGPTLRRRPAHQQLMMANLAASLIISEVGAITTTEAKAKALRPYVEKLITKAKNGGVHQQRQVVSTIHDDDAAHKLFTEIGPRYADRNGGYTRILKLGPRPGDNAPMARIELV